MASTPAFDASAIADPATATRDVRRPPRGRRVAAPGPGDPGPLRPGLGLQDRDGDRRPRQRVGLAGDDLPGAARRPRRTGLRRRRASRSATATTRSPGTRRSTSLEATEVSCNIWYALAGLDTGGANLDAFARRLGFGAPLPFDLPTAPSQLTNGGGPLRRLPGRRRAGQRRLRAGRGARHAAPDGARRGGRRRTAAS